MSKQTFFRKAIPLALTILGSASTVAAVIFAAKEGPKYKAALEEKDEDTKPIEKVATAVKIFAPAIGCAAVSIACAVGAHAMDMHTQASLTGAYAALQVAYAKYRKSNGEVNGPDADFNVMKKFVTDKLHKDLGIPEAMLDGDKECAAEDITDEMVDNSTNAPLFKYHDCVTDREFESTEANVIKAEAYLNKLIVTTGGLSVNDWCELLEIPTVDEGDNIGWGAEMTWDEWGEGWIEFTHPLTRNDDGEEIIEIIPAIGPVRDFRSYCEFM